MGDAEILTETCEQKQGVQSQCVQDYVPVTLCYCVPSVNLTYCSSLGCCCQVSPAATLVLMEQDLFCREPMASTALLAVSVWNWDSNTLPGSGALHTSGCLDILTPPWIPLCSCPVILTLFHMLTSREGALCDYY